MIRLLTNATNGAENPLLSLLSFLPMILILGGVYFFMFRRQQKEEKATKAMRDNLEVGDEVTTIGGIVGRIVSIKDETCVIETSRDGTKIRFLKTAISKVDVKAEDAK